MVGCWCGPQPCKFVGFLQPTFRKRVICNVSASTSWSSAAAPSSISVSNYKEVAWYAVFEACSSEFEKWHFDVFDESLKHQNEHFVQGFLHF